MAMASSRRVGVDREVGLSPRQEQILDLIALGMADKQIALQLGISQRTVRTHLERLFRSIGVRSRAEAVAVWLRTAG